MATPNTFSTLSPVDGRVYLDPALAFSGVKDSCRGRSLSRVGFEALTRPKLFHLLLGCKIERRSKLKVIEQYLICPKAAGDIPWLDGDSAPVSP